MINLDLKTFMFCMGLVALTFSAMSFAFSRLFSQRVRGLYEWSLALLCLGSSYIFYMLRDNAPAVLTHLLANSLVLFATSLLFIALLVYHGKIKYPKFVIACSLIFTTLLIYDYVEYGESINTVRPMLILFPSIVYISFSAYLILRNDRKRISGPSIIASIALTSLVVVMLFRSWIILRGVSGPSIFEKASATQIVFLTYAVISIVTSSLGFILMTIEQLHHEMIEQTAQAEHANRLNSLGEMAAGIAHEINNPLAIIQFSVDRLQSRLPTSVAKEYGLDEVFTRTIVATKRVAKIVKGLLDFSKEGSSEEMAPNYLGAIVEDTLILCSEKIASRSIKLEIAEIPAIKVRCNPVQISQIILNLLNNALDSLETEKSESKFLRIYFETKDKKLKFFIENSGPVISEIYLEKIFQPFFTTKEVGKGTGLGLSISLGIAQKHNGNLYLDTQKRYTTFVLELPILS